MILAGFALIGLTVVLLAYRVHTRLQVTATEPFPTTADFQLDELSDLRTLSLDDAALSVPPVRSPDADWSVSVHSLATIPEDRAGPLPELPWPPALAQKQEIREHTALAVAPDWSSDSHPAAPPPETPAATGAPALSGNEPMVAAARQEDPAPAASGWAPRDDLVLPPTTPPPESPPLPTSRPAVAHPTPAVIEEKAPPGSPLPTDALARNLTRGDLSRSEVLLSFDGGSEASAASSILDTLEREGVRTTLFLTGEFIRNHPDLVHRILARGHEIGNHTEHHRHFTTWESNRRHDTRPDVDRGVLLGELEGARQALLQVAGVDMAPFWRAPYGEVNSEILRWAAQAGYLHVGWSPGLDSLDWVSDPASRRYRSPQEFLSALARMARGAPHGLNGTIILMHLHSNRPWGDRFDRHLGETIRWLRAAGYDLVPASSLAGLTGVPGAAYRLTAAPQTEDW